MKDFFPLKVIFSPAEAFAGLAEGAPGWGWPLALYIVSMAASAFLLSALPPQFIAESFEGVALQQGRGFLFYLAISLPGGLLFSIFTCGLISAFTVFLRTGRLSPRLLLSALIVGVFGILAVAVQDSSFLRPAGFFAALAAAGFALWTASRDKKRYPVILKAVLALGAVSILADLAGGAAALAGSVKVYTASEYFFSLVSLIWLAKASAAVYDSGFPKAVSAAVLAMLGSSAFLFLLFNLRLLPPELFQVLLLI